ncbi:sulfotransferase [Paenibacillus thermotolerans]|uniref:sulfotransferase n=1 Tax=Paenibacillus thermotolerans TaxID=3027807 RepID=UPI0023689A5A|nr:MULTISPECIES: sulfotransferase [unclassified Paenibacillus]
MKRAVLVTGIHRSGTTFIGKVLSFDKRTAYIQEPFNSECGLRVFEREFEYVTIRNRKKEIYDKVFSNILSLKTANYKITPFKTPKGKVPVKNRFEVIKFLIKNFSMKILPISIFKLLFKSRGQFLFYLAKFNPSIKRLLIKDPIACLSSKYLHETFNMEIIVTIRHPLGFVSSLKRLGWNFNFRNLLDQHDLLKDHLEEFEEELARINHYKNASIIEQGTLLWLCIYKILFRYAEEHENIIIVKHEDLSNQPVETFRMLYEKLGMNFNEKIERKIIKLTNENNPVKAKNNQTHQLRRDSKKLVKEWKNRLTVEEINHIKSKTYELSKKYYDDQTWEVD